MSEPKKDKRIRTTGLHHITAFASEAKENARFYTEVLGLRLVKRTVNFDDPGTWHLYYGDKTGKVGTILTFFPIPRIARGRPGAGSVTHIAYSIPEGSLAWWEERLSGHGVATSRGERFGAAYLGFTDTEGLSLELIETDSPMETEPWEGTDVPVSHAIRGFHSATALVHEEEGTASVLTEQLGYKEVAKEGNRRRYAVGDGGPGTWFDVVLDPRAAPVRQGAGIVHHIAFGTPDDATQGEIRDGLARSGYGVSGVRDRQYFHSIYFNEPNGILFEVATNDIGFLIDEDVETLGEALKLPPQYESYRGKIEEVLPELS